MLSSAIGLTMRLYSLTNTLGNSLSSLEASTGQCWFPLPYRSFSGPIVDLSASIIGVLFRKFFPVSISSRMSPTSSSIKLLVFDFILSSLIHLELSFVQIDKYKIYLNSSTCSHPA